MEEFFTYWNKHTPVPPEVRKFIESHAEVINAQKEEYYIEGNERQLHWCFILEGLVAEYRINRSGKQIILNLSVANAYFTATKHPFTSRREEIKIQFLQDSRFIQIPNHIIQFAQKEYPAFSEFLHILKQKKLNEFLKMLLVLKQDTKNEQYFTFREIHPELIEFLTIDQKCALLNLNRSTYYRALAIWNRQK